MSLVVIACGGRGIRLGYEGQKCCVPVAGRPFLHWKLDELVCNGATDIILLVSHHADETIETAQQWGTVAWKRDEGRGPWQAVTELAACFYTDDPFWVTWGDTLYDHPIEGPAPLRYLTTELGDERPNVGKLLDAGLYHVKQSDPAPTWFMDRVTDIPTWTINTPEQLARTSAHLVRHGQPGRNPRVGSTPVG